ncbi:antirestriction protein ArdA [Mycolicibacterium sphagni]|uniref:Antirestriction protein n=1 Tax=Mycolicibacterium sphagni TaxID=1786 RepID=A0A255DGB3_9MYCO|nr:antirestriction protein ArdA [Mycolicibacterium sphagni]OYN77681.1 antirestriction protein [Mycolicibacterium sphagni]
MNETHHEPTQPEAQPDAATRQEAEPIPSPRIYVASLADYNNGVLHGAWINAAREPDDIQADIVAMLAKSREPNAEEWAIHDYDQFGRWRVNEYDSIEQVSRVAKGIAQHGYAFAAWADVFDGEPASFDTDAFQEAFLGRYDSVQDYVEQMADDLGYEDELARLPEHLRRYVRIAYGTMARDMLASGGIAVVDHPGDDGVWIFRADR